ncbi:MAG: lipoyl synthase [Candidatus Eutrophobiaceae bacterium]
MSELLSKRAQRGRLKVERLPIKPEPLPGDPVRKPAWIRALAPIGPKVSEIRKLLREHNLHTVCEEASCPNLGECFSRGTATFMIMGDICTRRCPFCDVAHGRPGTLDAAEPARLADAIALMDLRHVVITSVDRDDLPDRGAGHFVACIRATRSRCPDIRVEILTPDFRHRIDVALDILQEALPDVFNHNLETVPRLYAAARPVANYRASLELLLKFKHRNSGILSKSGLMLGLGEQLDEVRAVLRDLRECDCNMLTLGQYLQPSPHHFPVRRYVPPEEFSELGEYARGLGFTHVASAPMVRSSYHADLQAMGE